MREEWTALTDDADAFRKALRATGLSSDRTRYKTLLACVCANADAAAPLYVRYEGDLSALLRCLYCGLPRWTRRRIRPGGNVIFTTDDVSGRERRLDASSGETSLNTRRVERGGYLPYAAETLDFDRFPTFFDGLDRIAKALGDADASSEAIRNLAWRCCWDAAAGRFTDAPHLDGLSERELTRLLSDVARSGVYSEALRRLVEEAKRRAGTLTRDLQEDLSKWEEGCRRYGLELAERTGEYRKRVTALEARLSEQKTAYEKRVNGLTAQLSAQKADYERKLSGQKADYERRLSVQKADYEKRLSAQKAECEKRKEDEPTSKLRPKPVVPSTPREQSAPPGNFTFETLPEQFQSVTPIQFLEMTSRLFRRRHNFTPSKIRDFTRALYMELKRKYGKEVSPDYLLWMYMAALSDAPETLSAVKELYDAFTDFVPDELLKRYRALVRECKSATEIRGHAYTLVKETCFRNDAKRPLPLDFWIFLGKEGVQLNELSNCFAILEAKPNLSVLFAKPADTARKSEMLRRQDVQTYAATYVKAKGGDERVKNVVRQWLSEAYGR